MKKHDRRVVEGFKLPSTGPITENEFAWVEMLRLIVGDDDPPPTSSSALALRRALSER